MPKQIASPNVPTLHWVFLLKEIFSISEKKKNLLRSHTFLFNIVGEWLTRLPPGFKGIVFSFLSFLLLRINRLNDVIKSRAKYFNISPKKNVFATLKGKNKIQKISKEKKGRHCLLKILESSYLRTEKSISRAIVGIRQFFFEILRSTSCNITSPPFSCPIPILLSGLFFFAPFRFSFSNVWWMAARPIENLARKFCCHYLSCLLPSRSKFFFWNLLLLAFKLF